MKRRASRYTFAVTTRCRFRSVDLCVWKANPFGTEPCNIWRRGTCVARTSWGDANRATGILPFGRLVHDVIRREPYASADRVFRIVDNGSRHRDGDSEAGVTERDSGAHASRLNQIGIYFSIVQRKVLVPNDFQSLADRLLVFQDYYIQSAKPFFWNFDHRQLSEFTVRLADTHTDACKPNARKCNPICIYERNHLGPGHQDKSQQRPAGFRRQPLCIDVHWAHITTLRDRLVSCGKLNQIRTHAARIGHDRRPRQTCI